MDNEPAEKHQGDGYWLPRSHCAYYNRVRSWLNSFSPGGSLCDVGGHDTPVAAWGDFDSRTIVTKGEVKNRLPHIKYHITDFMDYDPGQRFDVVTCLQVLEHLDDETVGKFADKLYETAKTALIVSVPYLWKKGVCDSHYQDPINWEKFIGWFGREPDDYAIVAEKNGIERIVARFYRGSAMCPRCK